MSGHRPFKELRDKMSPERLERIKQKTQELSSELGWKPHVDEYKRKQQQQRNRDNVTFGIWAVATIIWGLFVFNVLIRIFT